MWGSLERACYQVLHCSCLIPDCEKEAQEIGLDSDFGTIAFVKKRG